jgi:hypothetical protein
MLPAQAFQLFIGATDCSRGTDRRRPVKQTDHAAVRVRQQSL